MFAHAGSFSWDEALMVLAPIAVLAAVLLYVNTKLRRGLGGQVLDDDPADRSGGPDGTADGTAAPAEDPRTAS